MRSLTSLLGSVVNGGSGLQTDDVIASLAFAVGLTVQPEHDVCFFVFSVFLAFQPDWVDDALRAAVCFIFSSLWTSWPPRDDTALPFLLLRAAACFVFSFLWTSWPLRDDAALAFLLIGLAPFAFSAWSTFRLSWDDATFVFGKAFLRSLHYWHFGLAEMTQPSG